MLDKNFGNKGIAQISVVLANGDTAVDAPLISQLSNGKFIVAVIASGSSHIDGYIYRLNNNGSVDNAFGNKGRVLVYSAVNSGLIYFYFNDLLIDSNDNIILSEYVSQLGNDGFTIVRLKKDGQYDSSFNRKGIKVIIKNTYLLLDNAVALRPSGKILVSTSYVHRKPHERPSDTTIQYQFRNDGSLDTSFNGKGYVGSGDKFEFSSMGVQPDGRVIYGGNYLEQLNFNGMQNLNFADTGTIRMFTWGYMYYIQMMQDGKFMCLVNAKGISSNKDVTKLIKFNKNGKLDSALNSSGILPIYNTGLPNDGLAFASNVIVQPNGKFLVNISDADNIHSKIRRYLSDGKIDSTFAQNGVIKTSYKINQIILQKNFKIVAVQGAHFSDRTDTNYFYVYRYYNDVVNSNISSSTPSEIKVIKTNSSIKISPNPVNGVLNIQGLTANTRMIIINSNGEKLASRVATSSSYKWNIQNLPADNYFLIASQNNKIIASLQFIKE